jgi:hypothetical protein
MGLFEQYPLLMVPVILLVVAAYDATKWVIRTLARGGTVRRLRTRT